ncbi:hypothetical protein CEXT_8281 [Caerostris extrusa]|uniref:Uncharacterized protein n=1 Tax=Caerostris extrusa TaxID=172846 RepID=A0AAV4Y7A9_CAEEX|nr:hypothetical protein CEXT_8281 [Caerostris extrusa]
MKKIRRGTQLPKSDAPFLNRLKSPPVADWRNRDSLRSELGPIWPEADVKTSSNSFLYERPNSISEASNNRMKVILQMDMFSLKNPNRLAECGRMKKKGEHNFEVDAPFLIGLSRRQLLIGEIVTRFDPN